MAALHEAVLGWYARERRDLPWRRTRDPYAILVSEVMLQQTQVARVIPRYEAWLQRWPDAAALAAAGRGDVLRQWIGLGYNARALRLHEACTIVARDGWPGSARELRRLPGVGPYTAAAVAAFAFGEQVAAVDTNVARVAARIGRGAPADLLPPGAAADWNQAMMELGATVCRARSARCGTCPAAAWCAAGGRRTEEATPRRSPAAVRFEQTNRFVRGRILAALAAGDPLPAGIAPDRLERALQGLLRDGLVSRTAAGLALG
jgi:A/G-specific adenine glycosylase